MYKFLTMLLVLACLSWAAALALAAAIIEIIP